MIAPLCSCGRRRPSWMYECRVCDTAGMAGVVVGTAGLLAWACLMILLALEVLTW